MVAELFAYYRLAPDTDRSVLGEIVAKLHATLGDHAHCRLYRRQDARGETWMEHYSALRDMTMFTVLYQAQLAADAAQWRHCCPSGRHEEWFDRIC